MSRYICIDDIRWADHHDADGNPSSYKVAYSDELPKAIEIVRCKDCKHYYFASSRIPSQQCWVCGRTMEENLKADDFCSYAERSEE